MKTGAQLISEERARQIAKEGWSTAHDDEHGDGSLAMAAACYALPKREMRRATRTEDRDLAGRGDGPVWVRMRISYRIPRLWPGSWHPSWWKPKDRVRDLVRAGALIAAEIDRLQRAAAAEQSS